MMPTDTPSPLAAAVEALLKAAGRAGPHGTLGPLGMRPAVDALRAALAADAAWQPPEVAPNPHEAMGRALCKAAGIDPDAAISDAGHSAWELVAHDALRGVLPAELRDAAWRARAEAAVAWVESYRNCRVAMRKADAERTQEADAECRAAFDAYDDARRRWEEAASNPRGREVVDG